jgi:hypothetical protein
MQRSTLSIANTMVPAQRTTEQSIFNPKEISPTMWMFDPVRTQQYDWQPEVAQLSNNNMFAKNEPYQDVKNGMFNPLTGREPIYGHVRYRLNPLDQEQTNRAGYEQQKQTRYRDNMDPAVAMRWPAYQYPVNDWRKVYQGSISTRPYTPFSAVPNQSLNPARM